MAPPLCLSITCMYRTPILACGGRGPLAPIHTTAQKLWYTVLYISSGSGSGQTRIILPDLDPDRDWHPGHADPEPADPNRL